MIAITFFLASVLRKLFYTLVIISETFVPNPCFLHTLLKPLLESFLNLKSYYENP